MGHGLKGRVAIVTGAGRGLGLAHALQLADLGARVIVNDLDAPGSGEGPGRAERAAEAIRALGGDALASTEDVADEDGARRVVAQAVDAFGSLDVLVNNAGILRDHMLTDMPVEDFDAVVRAHLRGTFCALRAAASYWRRQSEAGRTRPAAVVNTASSSGLEGSAGQINHGVAAAGIASLTQIAAAELGRYGVLVNAVAPIAPTRLAPPATGPDGAPAEAQWDAADVAPLVACLADPACPFTGQVFAVHGREVGLYQSWSVAHRAGSDEPWTVESLARALAAFPPRVPVVRQQAVPGPPR